MNGIKEENLNICKDCKYFKRLLSYLFVILNINGICSHKRCRRVFACAKDWCYYFEQKEK